MQSALGDQLEITAISKANPGVVTIGSPIGSVANGAYVVLSNIQGMTQVDGRVFRVAAAAGNTFQLEGEDTSLYDTFTSGVANVATLGTSLATATGLTASGGDFDFIDVTTIHDSTKKQIPGIASAAAYTFENLWDPGDTALAAMKTASDNQAQRVFRFTFSNGKIVVFNGYVGCTMLPVGNAQDKVTTQVVVTMFGRATMYAS